MFSFYWPCKVKYRQGCLMGIMLNNYFQFHVSVDSNSLVLDMPSHSDASKILLDRASRPVML